MNPAPRWSKHWTVEHSLGQGGQGTVSLVRRHNGKLSELTGKIAELINYRTIVGPADKQEAKKNSLTRSLREFVLAVNATEQGALKQLHLPENSRDAANGVARLRREIEAMQLHAHPHLLKILDADLDENWYVSEYHPAGTLDSNLDRFKAKPFEAIKAFRSIVEGVALLHSDGYIHRDIKPANIFVSESGELILGDFGLVYFEDVQQSRLSETIGNVGSRDWMPGWAQGARVEALTPAFDVFSLGKILWTMVSGKTFLRLWYHDEEEFSLREMYPDTSGMDIVCDILSETIVEKQQDCIPDANKLLQRVDQALDKIRMQLDFFSEKAPQCRICGQGQYRKKVDLRHDEALNVGLANVGNQGYKYFACSTCGHVEMFLIDDIRHLPAIWRREN